MSQRVTAIGHHPDGGWPAPPRPDHRRWRRIRGALRWLAPRRAGRPVRRRVQVVAVVVALLCVAGLTSGAWVIGRGWQAQSHLEAAATLAGRLQQQLAAGEVDQARSTLAALQHHTGAARDATGDPAWEWAARLPGPGRELATVATLATIVDDVARQALPLLVEVAAELDPAVLAPRGGRVELAPIQSAAPRIEVASRVLTEARDRAAAIGTGGLMGPVREAVERLRADLETTVAATTALARITAVLPGLLGAEGPRTYLVLFQNPAEVRATGGMAGAFAVLRAEAGGVVIVRQGTAGADLKKFDEPVLPLDPAMQALYTDRLGTYPANVNLTPHFPTAAALIREMYRLRTGERVDGVLATDPVVLSYLLRATGPLSVPDGPDLTADSAVRTLLSDVYATRTSNDAQDAYFAHAAVAAFDALLGGRADPRAILTALSRAVSERRVLLWSADPDQQRLIEGTVLAGELPLDDGDRPTVGVFLNDGSGAKLGYYLHPAAELTTLGQHPDGRYELGLRVRLHSTAPAEGLPETVLGLGLAGDPYTMRTQVLLFSPARGAVAEVRVDGEPTAVGAGTERKRHVAVGMVDVPPGGTVTIDVRLLTAVRPAGEEIAPELRLTPTATPWGQNTD